MNKRDMNVNMITTERIRAVARGVSAAALCGVCAALWSCEKDPAGGSPGRALRFDVAREAAWSDASGGASQSSGPESASSGTTWRLSSEGLEGELYLHAAHAAGIGADEGAMNGAATRAVPVTNLSTYGAFGALAFAWAGEWSDALTPNYMYNARVNKSGSAWTPEKEYFWPATAEHLRFYAYAPYDGAGIVLSPSTQAGAPTISYSVPADVAEQADLLTARTGDLPGNGGGVVPLSFSHALTAVKFSCGADMSVGTVRSISLKGVYSRGTYDLDTERWSGLSEPADFVQQLGQSTTGTPGSAITGGGKTFMLLPQTLPQGALIELVFNDGAKDHTLTADIGGTTWRRGTTVTYNLSTTSINWSYTLEVTSTGSYTYQGGSGTYNVKSSRTNSGGREPVAWEAQYSTDGGTTWSSDRPSWLEAFTGSDAGSTEADGVDYTMTVSPQRGTISSDSEHTQALRSAPEKGSASEPYDLSMYDIDGVARSGMTTANSYVVRAPGTYRIPLVYGNAVKDGATNEVSYNPGTVANGLETFVKHDDKPITSACLADNSGVVPENAVLLWNDANDGFLTVSPVLSTYTATIDGASRQLDYIVFTIDKDNIMQGNAMVAVRNSAGEVLWSWHIWVTDESLTPVGVTNHMDEVSHMMPVDLGWCSAAGEMDIAYAERSCQIRFSQVGSGNSRTITVTQTSYSRKVPALGGNSPYYQWGRKDPFLPSGGTASNTQKPYYGTKWEYSSAVATLGDNISHPVIFYNTSLSPNTSVACNLWNARSEGNDIPYDAADEPVTKTVYDPCPPGFRVASANAFTGFNTRGTNSNSVSDVNASGAWNGGWAFYCGKDGSGATLFFPAAGMRQGMSGGLNGVTNIGYCWTACSSSQNQGRSFNYNASYVYPSNDNNRSHGLSVRPVRE